MKKAAVLLLGGALAASISGCVATSGEIGGLRDDIHELQLKLNELHRNQADLSSKMDNLGSTMGPLTSQLTETQNRMSLLGQRLDDLESNLGQRMSKLTEHLSDSSLSVSPPPSEVYRIAYSDFSRGKYDLAIVGFKSYLDKYPQGELGGQAQYYLGECYYSQNKWDTALAQFEKVEKSYPYGESVPAARLKRALCLELLGRGKEGRELLRAVVKDYPNTTEAFTAQEKLKSYQTDGK
ncbi:MAG: tol-pal system protein YbgF [Endomicrobiales bacterium]